MEHFDLAVIGSGSGNSLISDEFADRRVALIDDGTPFGGTCLNHGCIPTKMFVYPADLARVPGEAARLGVRMGEAQADFAAIRDRIFGRIDPIAASGEEYRRDRSPHVTLIRATASFTAPHTLLVGDAEITADQIVLAAGSRPRRPDAPGADDPRVAARLHTSDTIMRVDALPPRLVILGGGYVAAEFAHVFSALGSEVTLVYRSERLLRREDADIAARYTTAVARDVELLLSTTLDRFEPAEDAVRVHVTTPDGPRTLDADAVLVAWGRVPNSDRLNLAAAGIDTDDAGHVIVDAHQRASADGVWALGDIAGPWQLKHVANHEARVVAHNLLHPDDLIESDHRFVPHAVFGHPQIASVGLTEADARAQGLDVAVATRDYGGTAYGWAMEDTEHCAKVIADRATGLLVGAHLIGPQASVLIQPLLTAMSLGIPAQRLARGQYWIHPALTEVVENALLDLEVDA